MTIAQLEQKIIEASQHYYSGEPIMSDHEWDGLLDYLRAANPNSDIFTKTGWGFDPFKLIGEKENHIYGKTTGIDKKPKDISDIPKDFFNIDICLSAKLDGLSMVCYFVNGKLTKALTRGNGITGINRTDKVLKILEKELNIPEGFDFTGAIRGEICISNENWNIMLESKIVTPDQNQRNVAAGIIGRDELSDDIKFVDLVFYKVVGYNNDTSLTYNRIYQENVINANNYDVRFLRKFIKPEYIVDYVEDNGSLINQNALEDLFNKFRNKYLCDGVVITKKVRNIENISTNKYMNNVSVINDEIAYKFVTEVAKTTIENIRWKMSKGNKAIPVINVTPVELSGATVSNATAFNAKYIYENDLDIGSEVLLTRSGEVIPYIAEVISGSNGEGRKKLDEMVCPYCNSKLEWDGVDLVCKNTECGNRDEQNLKVWVRTIAPIDGMSETLNFKFFNELNINSLDELYNKSYKELEYPGMASNSHKGKFNLVLNKLFNEPISFKDLLIGLNIKMLGDKNAEKLSNNKEFKALFEEFLEVQNIELFINNVISVVTNIVGPAMASNICSADGVTKIKNAIYVKDRIDYTIEEVKSMIPVVVTGKLSVPRKEFEKYLNDNGYELVGSVNKNIKVLITDNPNGNSSKNIKANELGIEKMTEEEFRNMVDENISSISINDIL